MEENTVSETSDLPSDEIVLSSGRTVRLPLIQTTTIHGVLVRIPYEYAQSKLPEALQPVWYTPTGAVMLVLGAEYPNERPYSLGPYDEFATLIPCTHKTDRVAPSLTSMLEMRSGGVWRLLDGYVTEMPVTSEDSNEMGHRCWELPKQVMQITNEDRGGVRRTSVKADGKRVISFEMATPRTFNYASTAYAYSTREGRLLHTKMEIDGRMGGWPLSSAFSMSFGEHPLGQELERQINDERRALARVYFDGTISMFKSQILDI